MDWVDEALDRLARKPRWGYSADSAPATEPTALAAMALASQGRQAPATNPLNWLADLQQSDGSLGLGQANRRPAWPTGWAVLAWQIGLTSRPAPGKGELGKGDRHLSCEAPGGPLRQKVPVTFSQRWADSVRRAVQWILSEKGRAQPRSELFAHDPTLQAWPWTEQTHSWVEPTAMHLLALKRSGYSAHARARDAVAMLLDRAMPDGGWNYGNPIVLGATLKPHVQPTGLALAALAGEQAAQGPVRRSLKYLGRALSEQTTTASLCFGLIGGSAHGWRPPSAGAWLEASYRRTLQRDASPYKLALLVLAARSPCPWYSDPS